MVIRTIKVVECDGCGLRVDGDAVPERWIQMHDYGSTTLFCARDCMVLSHAGTTPVTAAVRWNVSAGQIKVLELMALGLDNKAIGARLGLQPQTVRNRAWLVYHKLGVHTRFGLLIAAVRLGLIESPSLDVARTDPYTA